MSDETTQRVNPYLESLRLDRARIIEMLNRATHPYRRITLLKALYQVEKSLGLTPTRYWTGRAA